MLTLLRRLHRAHQLRRARRHIAAAYQQAHPHTVLRSELHEVHARLAALDALIREAERQRAVNEA